MLLVSQSPRQVRTGRSLSLVVGPIAPPLVTRYSIALETPDCFAMPCMDGARLAFRSRAGENLMARRRLRTCSSVIARGATQEVDARDRAAL
jgi:hypothetical protein